MIPLRLELKNFLSYGPHPQTINFEPYHLICLSGKNGHGKSAILDAITWAIWGQARKLSGTSKADDGLLHLGQHHMMVIIEFCVGAHVYRIRREYVKTKSKPFSSLDFGILHEDGSIKSLTDKTIKDTQKKIEEALGISYDAFVNSTFLKQGNSGEFSKKSSKERKQLLAQILQLQELETLKSQAQEQARLLQQELARKETVKSHIDQEYEELAPSKELEKKLKQEEKEFTKQKEALTKKRAHIDLQKQTYNKAKLNLVHAEQHIDELQNQEQQQVESYYKRKNIWLKNQTTDFAVHEKELQEQLLLTQKKLRDYEKKQQSHVKLREAYIEQKDIVYTLQKSVEETLQKEYTQLSKTCAQKTAAMHELQKKYASTQQTYTHTKKQLEEKQKECAKLTQTLQDTNPHIQHILQDYKQALHQYAQANYKAGCVFEKHKQLHNNMQLLQTTQPCCMVCEQQISGSRKKHLYQNLQKKADDAEQASTKQHALTDTIQQQVASLHTQYAHAYAKHHSLQEAQQQHTSLQKQCAELQNTVETINAQLQLLTQQIKTHQSSILPLQKKLDAWQSHTQTYIAQHTKLQKQQKKLHTIIEQGKSTGYQKQEHDDCLAQSKHIEKQLQDLQEQKKEAEPQRMQQELHQALSLQLQTGCLLYKKKLDLAALHKEVGRYEPVLQQEKAIEREWEDLQDQLHALAKKQGTVHAHVKKLATLTKHQAQLETEQKKVKQELFDYQALTKALSKDGLQALLIEQAIPEIEHEANSLLSQLTNNQTQIFIESLRDLKKGGHKETLDIKIADSAGIRPYEMFSGGEAFRIDFALRIAISKLLARRAGTNLQTLIIDEGFGSQDEEGLSLIMDCIHNIQDHFAKIIVISHLQDLQEQFPVHLKVQKLATGSVVQAIEQG